MFLFVLKATMEAVVTLDQVPRWSHVDLRCSYETEEDRRLHFPDPLTEAERNGNGMVSRFPVDHEISSKIYLWRGTPWNLEVDAVVNSTNENMDKAHCSPGLHAAAGPGLHAAAGPGLAEECATMVTIRIIKFFLVKISRGGRGVTFDYYRVDAEKGWQMLLMHMVYLPENALSHCYHSCLELLVENGLKRFFFMPICYISYADRFFS
ncbi:putative Macro domain-containing protein [Helianthus annuus]|nr:putative Macro domain-containing protein [Helianthus annuus]